MLQNKSIKTISKSSLQNDIYFQRKILRNINSTPNNKIRDRKICS